MESVRRNYGCAGADASAGRRAAQGACAVTGAEAPLRAQAQNLSSPSLQGVLPLSQLRASILFPPPAFLSDPCPVERFSTSFASCLGHIRQEASGS